MPGAPTEANKFISPSVSFRLEDAKPQQDTGALQLSSTERDKRRLSQHGDFARPEPSIFEHRTNMKKIVRHLSTIFP